jgi:hypothetical protein
MTRSHSVRSLLAYPTIRLIFPPLQEMAGFSPLGVLRDGHRTFDDSDPLPEPSDGILWPLFYVWRECRPVSAGRNVGDISNCYHWPSVLHCSELHIPGSRSIYRGQDCLFPHSIAPSAYFRVHPEDGELMAPLRFFSLISLGGILFKLSASHGTMVTSLFSNWEFFFLLQEVS